jgi:hypothetical protein
MIFFLHSLLIQPFYLRLDTYLRTCRSTLIVKRAYKKLSFFWLPIMCKTVIVYLCKRSALVMFGLNYKRLQHENKKIVDTFVIFCTGWLNSFKYIFCIWINLHPTDFSLGFIINLQCAIRLQIFINTFLCFQIVVKCVLCRGEIHNEG